MVPWSSESSGSGREPVAVPGMLARIPRGGDMPAQRRLAGHRTEDAEGRRSRLRIAGPRLERPGPFQNPRRPVLLHLPPAEVLRRIALLLTTPGAV